MKIIILQHDETQPKVLTQSDLAYSDTTYVVCSKYKIAGSIRLPNGCALRIEGGSIQGGWLEFPCVGQPLLGREWYSYLTLASRASMKIENGETNYVDSGNEYLTDGCFVKTTDCSFEMYLTSPCRILLPGGPMEGHLHVVSDKINPIQIDGKSNFTMHAQNCRFERIFDNNEGWSLNNRLKGNIRYNIFENCIIYAEDYPLSKTAEKVGSDFFTVIANDLSEDSKSEINATETINWFVAKQCVFNNIGITGNSVYVENCTFLFGKNVNDNHSETIHCGNHSRILNCLFDGRGHEGNNSIVKLNADVIDLFNGHDIVIDGCTFIGYEAESRAPGINMITVKSHYKANLVCESEDIGSALSNCLGQPQNGVVIRNCYFDLPNYIADIIEPWNGVVKGDDLTPEEKRDFNRQFTLIENNYVYAPKAICLVNCFGFSDYVAVCGNVGNIELLVLVNDNYPGVSEENNDKNIAHDLVIKNNILRFQDEDPTPGMTILFGSHIDNLELIGNKVDGYLWNGLNDDSILNLSGTIRICDNETIGPRGLFMDTGGIVIPDDLTIFFSGNISKGVNTDVGPLSVANDPSSGLKFVGRQFFCTSSPYKNQLIIYNGKSWASIITKGMDS